MLLIEFSAISWLVFWTFVLIFFIKYMKNAGKMSENIPLPAFEFNISDQLKQVIAEIKLDLFLDIGKLIDTKIKALSMDFLKVEQWTDKLKLSFESVSELKKQIVDEIDLKIALFKDAIGLIPDMQQINVVIQQIEDKFSSFKLPDAELIKNDIRHEITNAFNDENVKKISEAVLGQLGDLFKDQPGESAQNEAPGSNFDMNNFKMEDMVKLMMMQYFGKMFGGGFGTGQSGPALSPPRGGF